MKLEWPKRRRGRPTSEEREFRRRLEQENRERLRRGLVRVLVWKDPSRRALAEELGLPSDGHLFCASPCIVKFMAAEDSSWGWDAGSIIRIGRLRRGQWPFPRFEVRYHYAADVDHMRCAQCRKPFKRTSPDTPWNRRMRKKAREKWAAKRRDAARWYRAKLKERKLREEEEAQKRISSQS